MTPEQRQQLMRQAVKNVAVRKGLIQPPPQGLKGFAQNAKRDFGDFSKGMLGIGREFLTSPVYNTKALVSTLKGGLKTAMRPGERPERQTWSQLRQTPLEDQKRRNIQNIQNIEQTEPDIDRRRFRKIAESLKGHYTQYSRPGEKIYNEPFSALLDALPPAKAAGAGKVLKAGAKQLNKIPAVNAATQAATEAFVPMGKLRNLQGGKYAKVADDIGKTSTNIRRAQEGINKSTAKTFDKRFGLSQAQRADFWDTIDRGRRLKNYTPISKDAQVQKAIDWYTKTKLPKIQKGAGYTKGAPIENYLHHFFAEKPRTGMGNKLSAPDRGYLKRSKDVEGFVKDPVVSIAAIESKVATGNIKEAFTTRVFNKFAAKVDDVTEFEGGKIINKKTGEELLKYKGKYLPKDLAEELLRYEGKAPTIVDKLVSPLRAFNKNWKPLATATRPRYHLRNIVGNVYNASWVGDANWKTYFTAASQQMKGHIATQIKEGTTAGKIYKAFFGTPPEHKYIKMALKDDVIGRGFFAADLNEMAQIAETVENFTKAIKNLDSPAMVYKVPVLKQWIEASSRVGQAFEDNARLAMYIDRIKKGASRGQAKKAVNEHLFDYLTGLGEGDRYIKAIIPFWSWTRFNIPLQTASLGRIPLRNVAAQQFAKPYVEENERNNPGYAFLSEREKDMGSIKIGEEEKDGKVYDKYMRTQSVLPVADLSRIYRMATMQQDEFGITPLFNMLKQAGSRVNPPKDQYANLDYYGRPVEMYTGETKRYLGQPVRGTTKEIFQSIPALNELNKLFGGSYAPQDRPSLEARLGTVFNPTSNSLVDREKSKEYFQADRDRIFEGSHSAGYETAFKNIIKKVMNSPQPDKVLNANRKVLSDLLREGGYRDREIQELIFKAIEAELKLQYPKPTKMQAPRRPQPLIDRYYQQEVLNRASQL